MNNIFLPPTQVDTSEQKNLVDFMDNGRKLLLKNSTLISTSSTMPKLTTGSRPLANM